MIRLTDANRKFYPFARWEPPARRFLLVLMVLERDTWPQTTSLRFPRRQCSTFALSQLDRPVAVHRFTVVGSDGESPRVLQSSCRLGRARGETAKLRSAPARRLPDSVRRTLRRDAKRFCLQKGPRKHRNYKTTPRIYLFFSTWTADVAVRTCL
ncbi:hypothetical protein AXF42_Ash010093 [Apostasia shenzhenica]|uniref:Uncharacterized protein n=1 Tax=Apostasia shenzhenica TaxID=1088818 RepID=A0A2I0A9I0_9ASPA|nr:hypothetical protein AXF42_Ash010093 [Apostasia shenzhenica]